MQTLFCEMEKTYTYNVSQNRCSFNHIAFIPFQFFTLLLFPFQTGLSDSDLKALDDVFESTYMAKYPVVGYMDYLLESHPEKFKEIGDKKLEL